MKKRTGILGVLIALLALGIGYAAITAIPLVVTGTGTIIPDDDNFKVIFTDPAEAVGDGTLAATIDASDPTKATLSVTGFKKTTDEAVFTYIILNDSPEDISAELAAPTVTNSNSEYFDVQTELADPTTLAVGETTTLTVTVKPLKVAVGANETTNITVTVNASAATN